MATEMETAAEIGGFEVLGLDIGLELGVAQMGLEHPSPVQRQAVPVILDGRDVLVRARTGSGKTVAYLLPLLQRVLVHKGAAEAEGGAAAGPGVRGLVLVPSRELCRQVADVAKALTVACGDRVTVAHVGLDNSAAASRIQVMLPDVLVGTPSRVVALAPKLNLAATLLLVVVDEADLVLSYGYKDDMETLLAHFPRIVQTVLMSATLTDDVSTLSDLLLNKPVVLRIGASEAGPSGVGAAGSLKQFYIYVDDESKFLLLYSLLKLKVIRGKVLIFVNSIDRCYQTKLFLERFSLRAAVLNADLPANSRYSVVTQFGQGKFRYLIATDKSSVIAPPAPPGSGSDSDGSGDALDDDEVGVARGIDFKEVDTVINLDFPESVDAYVHRIGRTARGGAGGSALSMVSAEEKPLLLRLQARQAELATDAASSKKTRAAIASGELDIKRYEFDLARIVQFQYRVRDVLQGISRKAIREARLAEIRNEVLNSEKLKSHFEDNPTDLDALKHDIHLQPRRIAKHLAKIPAYLLSTAELRLLQKEADTISVLKNKGIKRRRKGRNNRDPLSRVGRSKRKKK